jgi:hypothetical protein
MRKPHRSIPSLAAGLAIAGLLLTAMPAVAAGLPPIVPECARKQAKYAPSLACALETFGNIAQLILGITGSFALLMFVYGGFVMLTSGGASERVSKGKTILTNAVIGILIIFTSGMLIQYGLGRLKITQPVIGQACDAGGGKPGIYFQATDGSVKCTQFCSELSGYACFSPEQQAGRSCLGLDWCQATGAGWLCCQQ